MPSDWADEEATRITKLWKFAVHVLDDIAAALRKERAGATERERRRCAEVANRTLPRDNEDVSLDIRDAILAGPQAAPTEPQPRPQPKLTRKEQRELVQALEIGIEIAPDRPTEPSTAEMMERLSKESYDDYRGEEHPPDRPSVSGATTEYQRLASQLRDVASRIGVATSPEWIRVELERLARLWDSWGSSPSPDYRELLEATVDSLESAISYITDWVVATLMKGVVPASGKRWRANDD